MKNVTKLWEFYQDQILIFMKKKMKKKKKLDVFNQIIQNLEKYTQSASQDEFLNYHIRNLYDIKKMTALEWWCQDQQRRCWSRVSIMTIDIFSISAMSNEAERIFSETCHTIFWKKAQMNAEILEYVECLKHWKWNRILNEWLNKK